jgi:hypothetical protein
MSKEGADMQSGNMTWKNIRLELARTREFPDGSASRCYLVRLPLDEQGLIDEEAVGTAPARATVRRFWPNEADMSGYVIRTPGGWAFSYRPGEEDDESVFHLETHPIRLGEYITLTEPDGERRPFRVASLKPAG